MRVEAVTPNPTRTTPFAILTLLKNVAEGRQRGSNTELVGDGTVFVERAVEVNAHEDILFHKRGVADGTHALRGVHLIGGVLNEVGEWGWNEAK